MNKVYFVRHAKPDFSVHDDAIRPLTKEGIEDSKKITRLLEDKNISRIYSSPYLRAIDTINGLSKILEKEIEIIEDFRERKVSDEWIEDFNEFSKKQWDDFAYKLEKGECLKEVQERNIKELHKLLKENQEENLVIGTHGTALSTIINYYKKDFLFDDFEQIKDIMPLVVYMEFDDLELVKFEYLEVEDENCYNRV